MWREQNLSRQGRKDWPAMSHHTGQPRERIFTCVCGGGGDGGGWGRAKGKVALAPGQAELKEFPFELR